MRNAPGFSMPRETPCRLTPLRKVESEHEALSLSSPAPTVRVPEAACDADSYLVFTATLVISFLSCSLSRSLSVPTTPPGLLFLCSPTTSAPWRAREEKRRDGTGRDETREARVATERRQPGLARASHADLHSRLCRFAALHPLDRAAGLTQNADLQHSRFCRFAALHLWMGAAALTREDPQIYYRTCVGFKLWTVRCTP